MVQQTAATSKEPKGGSYLKIMVGLSRPSDEPTPDQVKVAKAVTLIVARFAQTNNSLLDHQRDLTTPGGMKTQLDNIADALIALETAKPKPPQLDDQKKMQSKSIDNYETLSRYISSNLKEYNDIQGDFLTSLKTQDSYHQSYGERQNSLRSHYEKITTFGKTAEKQISEQKKSTQNDISLLKIDINRVAPDVKIANILSSNTTLKS